MVTFQADRTGGGEFEGTFDDLPVAGANSDVVFGGNHQFIPILRFVLFKVFVGTSERIIAALKLWFPDKDPAIGIGGGSKLELQHKVPRELLLGVELLDASAFGGCRNNDASIDCDVATVAGCRSSLQVLFGGRGFGGGQSPAR